STTKNYTLSLHDALPISTLSKNIELLSSFKCKAVLSICKTLKPLLITSLLNSKSSYPYVEISSSKRIQSKIFLENNVLEHKKFLYGLWFRSEADFASLSVP